VEAYVIAGIITSEPDLRFNDNKAIVKASVPLPHEMEYFEPQYLLNDFSKLKTF